MTFLEIKQDIYDRIGATQTPPTEVSRRIGRFVNRWNRKVLTSPGHESLRRTQISVASIANQATYGIALEDVRYFTETQSDRRIYEKTLAWYRERVPDPAAFTGTPSYFIKLGWGRLHTKPTNTGVQLWAKSTDAADTTQVLRAEVVRTDGYRAALQVTLNGTTAVTLSTTILDVVDVSNLFLSAVAAGTVTLHQVSGAGAELTKIPAGQTYPRMLRYALAPTPSQAITYNIDGIAQLQDLVQDSDEPFPKPDFHDILVDGGVHDEWKSKGRSGDAQELRNEVNRRLGELRMALLEWPTNRDNESAYHRTFDESIELPVADP